MIRATVIVGMIAILAIVTAIAVIATGSVTYGCQTHAKGCQKTQEAGTPAGDSPPEVSGCHFFDTQQCVRESTPP
jgi:hypothetical protein